MSRITLTDAKPGFVAIHVRFAPPSVLRARRQYACAAVFYQLQASQDKGCHQVPFSLLRGEQPTPPPPPPVPASVPPNNSKNFAASEPIDDYEKNLVDEEPVIPRPADSASPQALTDWFAANFLRSSVVPETESAKASGSGLRNQIFSASSNGGVLNDKDEVPSANGGDSDSYTSSSEDVIANLEAMNPSHFGKLPGYENFNRLVSSCTYVGTEMVYERRFLGTTISQETLSKSYHHSYSTITNSEFSRNTTFKWHSSLQVTPPASSMDTPLSSALSGTTLARALMSNTFVLSNDNRASRYRSGLVGLTRSDSMTLPRDSFQGAYNNDRFSVGPDAPALPSNAELIYEPPKKSRSPSEWREKKKQTLSRRSSTGSLSAKAMQDTISVSSNRPNSALFSPGIEFDINSLMTKSPESEKPPPLPRSPLPPTPKLPYSAGADSSYTQGSAPDSVQEVTQRFPLDSQLLSPDLNLSPSASSEGYQSPRNLEDVLNYYSLPDSPAPLLAGANYRPAVSPISEESSSQLSPPSIFRNDKRESQRSTPVGARSPLSGNWRGRGDSLPLPRTPSDVRRSPRQPSLVPVGERPRSITQIPSPSSSQSTSSFASAGSDLLAPPPVSSIFNRQRSGSAPSPIKVVRDSRDANTYQITVTPQISESGTPTTDEEVIVTQEFPETPSAFSPLLTTGTDESHSILQTLGSHEVAPMPNVPMSATFPNRNSSQPSLAQQLLLNRAGTTVRHAPQTSISKIKTNDFGGRSSSPSSRRIADISQHSSESSSSSLAKPEVTVEGPSNDVNDKIITEEACSHSPEEMTAPPIPSPSNLVSVDPLARSPSRGTIKTQNSDTSSMYTSSSPSSKPRNKSLPPIPTTPSPVISLVTSSPLAASSSHVSIYSQEPSAGAAAVVTLAPAIPPPPTLPPPSPTPSQKARAPPVRGRLPPALTINHSNISVAERAVAVSGTDTNSENSPASLSLQEIEVTAALPEPVASSNADGHPSSFGYKNEQFTGRASDIFRGTSMLGSPPPYYSVVGEGLKQQENALATGHSQVQSSSTNNYGGQMSTMAGPSTSTGDWTNSTEHRTPLARGDSTLSQRARMRPPLPAGPRRPSQIQMMGSFPPQRDRAGSVTSLSSTTHAPNPFVQSVRARSEAPVNSPKFQTPPPKWRGYTMEAAKWTFTSAQLQAIVSRAIRQSAEASSIRLLRLEILDNEIPEEIRRLEAQRTDLKTRYKVLTRRRAVAFESLSSYVSGVEEENPTYALRLIEELKELAAALDKIAEELHSVDGQLDHLSSLTHIHTGSALAMALRKLNASFLKQVADNQVLRNQIQALEAERDEAWQQAEFVANEYDRHVSGSLSSKRSSRVSAVRKSSIRVSKAGLRTPSQRLSQVSSLGLGLTPSSAKSPLLRLERIPPVPPIPKRRTRGMSADSPLKSSAALSPSGLTPTSETRALIQAQDELYAILGLNNPERPLRRSLSFSMLTEQPPGMPRQPLLSPKHSSMSSRDRRSSLPGDNALAETYNAMAADRNAMLATIDMLSSTD
ncbi:hypothetical protein CPB84DRAFT_1961567 [Gymnopilus junonius]|uniref:Uncharacterized protein n=1 Tax=Gymnopilus junonius TaxID=109634 RepID=A0A9P5NR85_GYMJU|nr:hypothetical protein CPB84DRAFT_1961567 [Gymnopilus junonius]